MKRLLTLIFIIVCFNFSYGQAWKGLNYRVDYDRINRENNRNEELNRIAAIKRYNGIKQAYYNALNQNRGSNVPTPNPSDGWYKVLATNGNDFVGNRRVYLEHHYVKKFVNGVGEEFVPVRGGEVVDFNSVVMFSDNSVLELFFNILLEE
jgi:hypothetical protein